MNGSTKYTNPVVRGNAPDPSIVRVGEDFYLATSTFDSLPGITVRHSTNLVEWTIIGAGVTRPSQYRRDGIHGELMLYAPTLRYAEGTFYLACTNFSEGQGNFILSTTDPTGEWSDALWLDTEAFDPSLLYDEGTWYYTRRTLEPLPDGRLGPVVQAELDMATGQLGDMREISPDYAGFSSNDIEGPHLYHVGNWYYLFSAEGSTWKGHMQTCARSRSPWGPFEPAPHNPVITHRHRVGHPIQTLGHADLVQAADGSWWAVSLGTRHMSHGGFVYHHNLGRETFLLPVEWTDDGWPVVGSGGTTEINVELDRTLPHGTSTVVAPRTLWNEGWTTLGAPLAGASLAADGAITVPHGAGLETAPGLAPIGALFRAQKDDDAVFAVTIQDVPEAPATAGIAAFADLRHHFGVALSRGVDGAIDVCFRRVADDLTSEHRMTLAPGAARLTITASAASYLFDINGTAIGTGSARLLSAETAEAFVGVNFALTGTGPGSTVFTDLTSE